MMNDFHFLRPHFLYLFIPFALLILLGMRKEKRADIWETLCSKDLMPYILTKNSKSRNLRYFFMFPIFALLIMAAAGPAWDKKAQPLIKRQSGLIIALDLSQAMNAEDVKPSRLQRALYKINDILSKRPEGQTAFLVFSGDVFTVTPLTDDIATIKSLLPVLDTNMMPSGGHNVSQVVAKASELLTQAGISNGSLLLLTSELTNQDLENAIKIAASAGLKVSILGVGTEDPTPIPKAEGGFVKDAGGGVLMTTLSKKNLKQLAHTTHGMYASLSADDGDINALSKEFALFNEKDVQAVELSHDHWHDQGYLLVLFALPFVSLIFRRGFLAWSLLLMPQFVQASAFADLWRTPDQKAQELFHQEKYEEAKDLFQNKEWQAATHFKLGEYETAAQLYEEAKSVEGLFNYGTAKARLGDFEKALAAYNSALESQPDHEDALYNKKIIEDFLKQQESSPSDKEDQKSDKQENKDKNQNQDQNQNGESDSKENSDKSKEENQEKGEDQGDQADQNQENSGKEDKESKSKEASESPKQQKEQDLDKKQLEELADQYRDKMEKEMQEQKKASEAIAEEEKESSTEDAQRQIDDRWLERIQEDPAGLLRRKFLQQYRQQHKIK